MCQQKGDKRTNERTNRHKTKEHLQVLRVPWGAPSRWTVCLASHPRLPEKRQQGHQHRRCPQGQQGPRDLSSGCERPEEEGEGEEGVVVEEEERERERERNRKDARVSAHVRMNLG